MAGTTTQRIESLAFEELWAAAIVTDVTGTITHWNRQAEELYGWRASEVIGRPIGEVTVMPDDADLAFDIMQRLAAGEPWEGTFRVRRRDGSSFVAYVRDVPLLDDRGTVSAILGLSADATEPPLGSRKVRERVRDAAAVAESRLARLQAVTTALSGAATVDQVGEVILGELLAELGARSAALWLVDERRSTLWLARHVGLAGGVPERFATMPLDGDLPGPVAVRTATPAFVASRAERDRRWPGLAGIPTEAEAIAVVPLVAGGTAIGCLAFGFSEAREIMPDEQSFLAAVGDQCAVAIDRAVLLDLERQANQRLTFLADSAALLAGSLDSWDVLDQLTELAVPSLADWCAVHVPDGDRLRRIAVSHASDPDLAVRLRDRFPVGVDSASPVAVAFRSGLTQEIPEITEEMIAATSEDPEFLSLARSLTVRSGVAVPMRSRGETLGVVTLVFQSGRTFDPGLRALAEDVAARAAVALDNARLYDRQRRISEALQRAILPGDLPALEGHTVVGHYVPSGETGLVGGDWWDAFHLPDGRFGIVIGDVAGHDVNAASAMAVVRNTLRAYAFESRRPGEALTRANRLLLARRWETLASALYAVYDAADGTLAWASAGHPPPVRAGPAGCGFVVEPPQPVLAVIDHDYDEATTSLRDGEALLLYSDGLVEGRGRDIESGQRALLEVVERNAGEPVGVVVRAVLDALATGVADDDVSILALARGEP